MKESDYKVLNGNFGLSRALFSSLFGKQLGIGGSHPGLGVAHWSEGSSPLASGFKFPRLLAPNTVTASILTRRIQCIHRRPLTYKIASVRSFLSSQRLTECEDKRRKRQYLPAIFAALRNFSVATCQLASSRPMLNRTSTFAELALSCWYAWDEVWHWRYASNRGVNWTILTS